MSESTLSSPPLSSEEAALTEKDPPRDMAWSELPHIAASGICMGTADIVPGVSGGTMAVALGIYHRLLAAIASFNVDAIRAILRFKIPDAMAIVHWRFLCTLFAGMVVAFGIMLKIVKLPVLIQEEPRLVYAVFFGLVLGSAAILGRRIPWTPARIGSLVGGAALGFTVVNLVPVDTPTHPLFIFFCGLIAISAMILPGISGSFILLILGKYAYILGALSDKNLMVILPFVLGCAIGITSMSRFLSYLLTRWEHTITAGLVGLLLGSLWRLWPYQNLETIIVRKKPRVISFENYWPETFEMTVLALLAVGIVAVFAIEFAASRRTVES
ncbi:MAG: DUF368 domain-containing protein [Planctomycetes bacterium]|nr:DUF368 domain-containing protein [Planctomycetota bacterium]